MGEARAPAQPVAAQPAGALLRGLPRLRELLRRQARLPRLALHRGPLLLRRLRQRARQVRPVWPQHPARVVRLELVGPELVELGLVELGPAPRQLRLVPRLLPLRGSALRRVALGAAGQRQARTAQSESLLQTGPQGVDTGAARVMAQQIPPGPRTAWAAPKWAVGVSFGPTLYGRSGGSSSLIRARVEESGSFPGPRPGWRAPAIVGGDHGGLGGHGRGTRCASGRHAKHQNRGTGCERSVATTTASDATLLVTFPQVVFRRVSASSDRAFPVARNFGDCGRIGGHRKREAQGLTLRTELPSGYSVGEIAPTGRS